MNPKQKSQLRKLIKKCQSSPVFFINKFCKIEHPKAGIIPFKLFDYQIKSIEAFLKHRFNIYRKCRQCAREDSPVWTPNGPVCIADIKIGDRVYSVNPVSGMLEVSIVECLYDNGISDEVVEISSESGKKLYFTSDHEFMTHNGWVAAAELNRAIEINDPECGPISRFENKISTKGISGSHKVYDLRVPPYDNYIVDGFVAHNCGISTLCGAFSLWYSMFFSNKTILIVSKRDRDAKAFLEKNVKSLYQYLPDWMKAIWQTPTWNEHEFGLANNSKIVSLTSSPETLRSNASSLNIIDEAAFIPHMNDMWAAGYSCISPDHIINVDGGLSEIGDLGAVYGDQWQDIDVEVQSDDGARKSDKFYVNGEVDINIIRTSLGYEIGCTDNHRVRDENYEWIYSKDVVIGQKLTLKAGHDFDTDFDTILIDNTIVTKQPQVLDEKLAEIVGYYVGDGYLSRNRPKRFRLFCNPQDEDLYSRFADYFKSLGLRPLSHRGNSTNTAKEFRIDNAKFVEWFVLNGFASKTCAHDACVPKIILRSSTKIRAAFLRGLFEADGWSYTYKDVTRPTCTNNAIGFSTVSEKLSKQVHMMLLDLGIIARRKETKGGYKNSGKAYRIEIINKDNQALFVDLVGFISRRKSSVVVEKTAMKPIKFAVGNSIFYDEVVSVERSRSMTVDISVPHNNTYIANGFVSHNTLQHGGCLARGSLVSGNGLRKINSYHHGAEEWIDSNGVVMSDTGSANVVKAYDNGIADTRKITTSDGHFVEATLNHKFRVLSVYGDYKWKHVGELEVGDNLVLSDKANIIDVPEYVLNTDMIQDKSVPTVLTSEMAELLGIIWGDGFYTNGRFGISCNRKDVDYIEHVHHLVGELLGVKCKDEISDNDYSVRFNSKAFDLLLRRNSIIKQRSSLVSVPNAILESNSEVQCAFLRGLFEADGCVSGNYVSLSSSSLELIRQVQVMLLNLGMRTRQYRATRINGYSDGSQHVLNLKTRRDILRFRDMVGFISNRKRLLLCEIKESSRTHKDRFVNECAINEFYKASKGLPSKIRQDILRGKRKTALPRKLVKNLAIEHPQLVDTTLGFLASNDLFVNTIESIEDSNVHTYDIMVDDPSHTYIANGFVSHNSVIVVSTSKGVGNWYWRYWTDAEIGVNDFNPIIINWWDMTWSIGYKDDLSNRDIIIAPTAGIRKTKDELERNLYGPYWSPWLEQERRNLTEKGDDTKFRQEVLAEFIGTGDTVLSRETISKMGTDVRKDYKTVGYVDYVNPVTGEREKLNFDDELWVWETPKIDEITGKNGEKINVPHLYVAGCDVSTGEADDFSAISVLDMTTFEQVAELKIKVRPKIFAKMIDYIGRWYNNAAAVVENTGIGNATCTELYEDLMYPNMYRSRRRRSDLKYKQGKLGFSTTGQSKPLIDKALIDGLGEGDGTVATYSSRLYKEAMIYVRLTNTKTGAEPGKGNNDDLMIATGLALVGAPDIIRMSNQTLIPHHNPNTPLVDSDMNVQEQHRKMISMGGGRDLLLPMLSSSEGEKNRANPSAEVDKFSRQLGGIYSKSSSKGKHKVDTVRTQRNILKVPKKK